VPGCELAARYRSATSDLEVGGDFYDVFEADDGWLAILGDVCGKGPQAAALTALTRYTTRAAAMRTSEPEKILTQLNAAMLRHEDEQRFATAFLARVVPRPDRAEVTCASAGHPVALLLRADGEVTTVGGPGHPLGIVPAPTFYSARVDLLPGDTLVMYTDGLTDVGRPAHVVETDTLRALLAACAGFAPEQLLGALERFAERERGSRRQRDDIALLALRKS
jgi:serine phosphatase RsbU (regulator of sigma subunit)